MEQEQKRPRLDNPKEFAIIKRIHFGEKKETEESDRDQKRNKKQANQAR